VDVNIGVCKYPEVEAIQEGLSGLGVQTYIYLMLLRLLSRQAMRRLQTSLCWEHSRHWVHFLLMRSVCSAAVRDRVPQKALDVNLKAFELGKKAMKELMDTKKLGKTADCTGVS
jgi:hypothetical protein